MLRGLLVGRSVLLFDGVREDMGGGRKLWK